MIRKMIITVAISGLMLLVLACSQTPNPTAVPVLSPTAIVEDTTDTSTPAPQLEVTPGSGLTLEEYLATTPPPPQNLRVEWIEGTRVIAVEWNAPATVEVEHMYSDNIIRYQVFRRTGDGRMELLGTTDGLHYDDVNVNVNQRYFYTVVAVHEGDVHSAQTDEAELSTGSSASPTPETGTR